jgi:phage baseplate assembly protein W
MSGMSSDTGVALQGLAHLRQSLSDILATPIGARVMRRTYGARVSEFVDAPINRRTLVSIVAASAAAIARWEPRIKLKRIYITQAGAGFVTLAMDCIYLPLNAAVTISDVQVRA